MNRWGSRSIFGVSLLLLAGGFTSCGERTAGRSAILTAGLDEREVIGRFADMYFAPCHNRDDKTAGLALEALSTEDVSRNPKAWETVVRKLVARQMPPDGEVRPTGRKYDAIVTLLEGSLDRAAAENPEPGRAVAFRRLNRTEYQNVIRDLLALDVDARAMLPADESSHGFDNITVGDLSPTLLDRYITAAQKISRLAVGSPGRSPGGETIRIRPDLTQEEHVEGLPIGTRGGALIPYTFPEDGEYEVQVRLNARPQRACRRPGEPHELEVRGRARFPDSPGGWRFPPARAAIPRVR